MATLLRTFEDYKQQGVEVANKGKQLLEETNPQQVLANLTGQEKLDADVIQV